MIDITPINIAATMAAIIILVAFLKPDIISELTERLSHFGIPGFSPSASSLHGYENACLTTKSYGFPGMQNMYNYWKDQPKHWAVEYSNERIRGDINKVKSSESKTKGIPAPSDTHSIALEYYHDPIAYCKKYPDRYPCPNYWIAREAKAGFKGNKNFVSDDMFVPGLLEGNFGHVKDKDINDNYHSRIVEPGREDHGLCNVAAP